MAASRRPLREKSVSGLEVSNQVAHPCEEVPTPLCPRDMTPRRLRSKAPELPAIGRSAGLALAPEVPGRQSYPVVDLLSRYVWMHDEKANRISLHGKLWHRTPLPSSPKASSFAFWFPGATGGSRISVRHSSASPDGTWTGAQQGISSTLERPPPQVRCRALT